MKTYINKKSPRYWVKVKYSKHPYKHAWDVQERIDKEIYEAVDYPVIKELNKNILLLGKDCELTGRVKYLTKVNEDGTTDPTVHILAEIEWDLTKIIRPGGWFSTREVEIEKHTTWIPWEAFSFDFSDEVQEEIYEC